MNALFPDLLFLGPYFAPLMLRVGLALYFALYAYTHWKQGTQKSKLLGVKEAVFGLLFLAGFLTQLVAAAGILLVVLRGWWLKDGEGKQAWAEKSAVIAAQLALILLGAGAFALDLPY